MMKYGLDIPISGAYADPYKLAGLAIEAEEAGWDGFFLQDMLSSGSPPGDPIIDPWIALAAIAMRTQRVKIGIFLTPLPRRRPWQVARETVALDILSHGRLIFGAGLGFQAPDFTPFDEEYDTKIRAEKLDEGLEVLNGLWSGETFNFHGMHYQIDDVVMVPKPLQTPRIPVWLAGGWPRRKPFRRAARWDGVYVMTYNQVKNEPITPEEVQEIVAYLDTQRVETTPFDVAVNGVTFGNTQQDVEIVQPFIEAGATWWIEYEASRETFEQYRDRIRKGPPRIS